MERSFCKIEGNELRDVVIVVDDENFLFCSHGPSLFQLGDGHAGVSFPVFTEAEGFYVLVAL